MRVRAPPALAFLLGATLLVGMLPSGQSIPDDPDNRWADIQGIRAGDYWDFRVSGQENGDIHNEVIGVDNKANDHGKVLQTYQIRATGTLESRQRPRDVTGTGLQPGGEQSVTVTVDIKKWVRTSDYAVHQIEGHTDIEGGAADADTRESFDPPLVEVVYPFQEGYKWRSWSNWKIQRGGDDPSDDELSDVVTVLGKENITVPAGTFETWKLHFEKGRNAAEYKIQWYSEETCDIVKEERYGQEGLINKMELLDYKCSHIPKENPTYDPKHVALLAVGDLPQTTGTPPGPAFSPLAANESGGLSMWWVALGLGAVAGAVMIVVKRR